MRLAGVHSDKELDVLVYLTSHHGRCDRKLFRQNQRRSDDAGVVDDVITCYVVNT